MVGGSLPPKCVRWRARAWKTRAPKTFQNQLKSCTQGFFWGGESKNDLRFDFWIDGWAVWLIREKKYCFEDLVPDFKVSKVPTTQPWLAHISVMAHAFKKLNSPR